MNSDAASATVSTDTYSTRPSIQRLGSIDISPRARHVAHDGRSARHRADGLGASRQCLLEILTLAAIACGMGWLRAARPYSTGVLVPRRCGAPVLHRLPDRARAFVRQNVQARRVARFPAHGVGIFLRSVGRPQAYYTFEDTLSQIGLGYAFLFLLGLRSTRVQWIHSSSSCLAIGPRSPCTPARSNLIGWPRA